jgi:hypothetical protein
VTRTPSRRRAHLTRRRRALELRLAAAGLPGPVKNYDAGRASDCGSTAYPEPCTATTASGTMCGTTEVHAAARHGSWLESTEPGGRHHLVRRPSDSVESPARGEGPGLQVQLSASSDVRVASVRRSESRQSSLSQVGRPAPAGPGRGSRPKNSPLPGWKDCKQGHGCRFSGFLVACGLLSNS